MKNIISGGILLTLLSLGNMLSPAKAYSGDGSDAKGCVYLNTTKFSYPVLVNICPYPIEAVWCSDIADCDGYDSRQNIKVGGTYPVERSIYTWIGACRGFDSVSNINRFNYDCVEGRE